MTMDPSARTTGGTLVAAPHPRHLGLVAALLLAGFAGHLLAARLIGSRIAYRDHIEGYFLIAVVTGVLLLGLERLFWRVRRDLTLLYFAVVQALLVSSSTSCAQECTERPCDRHALTSVPIAAWPPLVEQRDAGGLSSNPSPRRQATEQCHWLVVTAIAVVRSRPHRHARTAELPTTHLRDP
jgi:hypothetical protein